MEKANRTAIIFIFQGKHSQAKSNIQENLGYDSKRFTVKNVSILAFRRKNEQILYQIKFF